MTIEERTAELYGIVQETGFGCLVMGGHAVRYYGFDRRTVDFDFQLSIEPEQWHELAERLAASGRLPALRSGESWRPEDFRRFVVGTLPDGREERLEFWRRNHLLAPFAEAWSRREDGIYGGRRLAFLGLDDLIHSKETERDDDWADVKVLEELADERRLARTDTTADRAAALGGLRSRRGFELASKRGLFADAAALAQALSMATHPITRAFLSPHTPSENVDDDVLWRALGSAARGSGKHLALVEAVRNRYRMAAAQADRVDKEAQRRRA